MRYVDIGIPANNKGKHNSNGRLWLTAKEEEEEAESADYVDYSAPALGGTDQWSSQIPDAQWNNEGVQAAISAVPGATGWTADAVPSADGWDVAPEPTLAAAPGLDITQPGVVAPTWE
ncbi:small ribosomal subunit protein uS2-like [Daucus carota subsp. sativus]